MSCVTYVTDDLSGRDRSLMKEHLPLVFAPHPYRGVVGGRVRGCDVIRRQRRSVREGGDVEVAHCGGTRGCRQQRVRKLTEVEDPPRGTELLELRREQIGQLGTVRLPIRVQEPFLKRMQLFLELSLGHGVYLTTKNSG